MRANGKDVERSASLSGLENRKFVAAFVAATDRNDVERGAPKLDKETSFRLQDWTGLGDHTRHQVMATSLGIVQDSWRVARAVVTPVAVLKRKCLRTLCFAM